MLWAAKGAPLPPNLHCRLLAPLGTGHVCTLLHHRRVQPPHTLILRSPCAPSDRISGKVRKRNQSRDGYHTRLVIRPTRTWGYGPMALESSPSPRASVPSSGRVAYPVFPIFHLSSISFSSCPKTRQAPLDHHAWAHGSVQPRWFHMPSSDGSHLPLLSFGMALAQRHVCLLRSPCDTQPRLRHEVKYARARTSSPYRGRRHPHVVEFMHCVLRDIERGFYMLAPSA